MKLVLRKTSSTGCEIATDNDYESDDNFKKFQKIKFDSRFVADIKQPRNIKYHRGIMALFKMIVENNPNCFRIVRDVIDTAKDILGMYSTRTLLNGKVITEFKSISFANMDQTEFDSFVNQVIPVFIKCGYLPDDFSIDDWFDGFK